MKKYKKIRDLIALFEEFEAEHQGSDLKDFGIWLQSRKQASTLDDSLTAIEPSAAGHVRFYNEMKEGRKALTLVSRAARFIDFYMKKAFEDLPVQSRLEFQFLVGIRELGNPRKTDLIVFSISELSTGLETLKRMKKNGLVIDIPDKTDGRIRRVALTPEGKDCLNKALERFDRLDSLAYSFGAEAGSLLGPLQNFNDHQNEVYFKNRDSDFNELIGLNRKSNG